MSFCLNVNGVEISKKGLKDLPKNDIVDKDKNWKSDLFEFASRWLGDTHSFKIYTSGSTGEPKEIIVNRKDIELSAKYTIDYFGLDTVSTALLCLPVTFIAGKMMLVRAIQANYYLFANKPVSNPLKDFGRPVNFLAITPHQFHEIIHDPDSFEILKQCDQVIVGGGQINLNDLKAIAGLKNNIYATYGMTETLTHIAVCKLNNSKIPLAFNTINERFKLSVDDRSCLNISTPYAHARHIRTNDVCHLIHQKAFVIKGRIDNVINSGGLKIFPESIENEISSHIKDPFFIASQAHEALGEEVVLFIQAEQYNPEKSQEILNVLKSLLDHKHEIPRIIQCLPKFVYTESGKINRRDTLKWASNNIV